MRCAQGIDVPLEKGHDFVEVGEEESCVRGEERCEGEGEEAGSGTEVEDCLRSGRGDERRGAKIVG